MFPVVTRASFRRPTSIFIPGHTREINLLLVPLFFFLIFSSLFLAEGHFPPLSNKVRSANVKNSPVVNLDAASDFPSWVT